jgi:hypothetical protein
MAIGIPDARVGSKHVKDGAAVPEIDLSRPTKNCKNPPRKGGYSAFWKIVPKAGARLEK